MIITNYKGFFSAAGTIGPKVKMDHDVSLFIPEIWSRMPIPQRDPEYLIKKGHLEKLKDFEHKGKNVQASLLGYRITDLFVASFMGKIFDNPRSVFNEDILKPELQDMDAFVDGMDNLVGAYQRAAQNYFNDGSIEFACPPLKALLSIMAHGQYEGKNITDPAIRQMFSREALLASDWYKARLKVKQDRDMALWTRHVKYLKEFMDRKSHKAQIQKLDIAGRLKAAESRLKEVSNPAYLQELVGTIGADPIC